MKQNDTSKQQAQQGKNLNTSIDEQTELVSKGIDKGWCQKKKICCGNWRNKRGFQELLGIL